MRKSFRLVSKGHVRWACEEWVGYLDLEVLGLNGDWLAALGISQLLGLEFFLPLLGCFVHDLVTSLL